MPQTTSKRTSSPVHITAKELDRASTVMMVVAFIIMTPSVVVLFSADTTIAAVKGVGGLVVGTAILVIACLAGVEHDILRVINNREENE